MPKSLWEGFIKILAPYAPHLAEELWEKAGHTQTITYESWPTYDEKFCVDDSCTIVVQVNGKKRHQFQAPIDGSKEELEKMALEAEPIKKFTEGNTVVKVIVVPNKLVNIVVK